MVELSWGLQPRDGNGRPFTVIRAEGRSFPTHRCLVPPSEFRMRIRGRGYSFSLADGDWFYFAGIWRPETHGSCEAYAILTIEPGPDVARYHDRQMAVLRRAQRFDWLDATIAEGELLRPLPAGELSRQRGSAAERAAGVYGVLGRLSPLRLPAHTHFLRVANTPSRSRIVKGNAFPLAGALVAGTPPSAGTPP